MDNGLKLTPNKKKIAPLLFSLIGCVFLVLFILLALLPSILSSNWGKNRIFNHLKSKYDLDGKCEQLSLSWFGPIEITDLALHHEKNKFAFDCDIIKTESGLIALLLKHDFGHLYFDRPHLKVSPSLVSFLSAPPLLNGKEFQQCSLLGIVPIHKAFVHFTLPSYTGTVNCTLGKLELLAAELSPILFDEITLNIENSVKERSLVFSLSSQTLQNGVQGKIVADGNFLHMGSTNPDLKMNATLSQLPVAGIDQLVAIAEPKYKGILVNLIGQTADLKLDASSTLRNFDIDFNIASPLFNGALSLTTSEEGKATLKEPAQFSMKITPASFHNLSLLEPQLASLTLLQDATFRGSLDSFSCMIPQSVKDLLQASFEASIAATSALNFQFQDAPLTLDHFSLMANNATIAGSIHFDGKAALATKEQSSECSIEGIIDPISHNGLFSFDINALPVDLVSKLAKSPLPLSPFLGTTASLKGSGTIGTENRLRIKFDSPQLQLQEGVFSITDRLTLLSPTSFSYTLTPEALKSLTTDIALTQPTLLQGTVNALSLSKTNLEDFKIDIAMTSESIALLAKAPFSLQHIKANLTLASLDEISIALSTDRIHINSSAKYQPRTKELQFLAPLQLDLAIDDEILHAFYETPLLLKSPAQLKLIIDPFNLSLHAPLQSAFKGKATLSRFAFLPFAESPQVALQNLEMPFAYDGAKKTATVNLSANIEQQGQSIGTVSLKSTLEKLQLDNLATLTANALLELQQLPSSFPDAFLKQPLCTSLFGPHFSTTLKIQSTPDLQNLGLTLNSPQITLKSNFAIKGQMLSLSEPAQIQWTLTPGGYRILDQWLAPQTKAALPFALKEPTTFKGTITKLLLPLAASQNRIPSLEFDLSTLQCVASGTNPSITFIDNSSQEPIQFTSLDFTVNKAQKQEPLALSLSSNVSSASKSGSFALNAKVENLFKNEQLDLSTLTAQVSFQMKQFPSRALDIAARLKGRTDFPFSKVFGDTINASLETNLKNLTGPLKLNVNSPQARISLDGSLQNGALLLSQPIYAQMKVTPEMSRLFLKEVNPLSISYFYSEAPVTLEIPARGFSLPLFPSDQSKISIPTARIELGKIACRNEGNINAALSILKSNQFDRNKELLLWFAPIDLHIQNGVLDLERTEILLAQTFDIAIWGKVYFVDDNVDMVLGLTAQTLYKAFGLKNLPEDYVLTIPMKGKMDNVKINTSKATAKIALLLASQQKGVSDAFGKSPAGQFFGGVLQQMATLPGNGDVPPAKHPFPWERSKTGYEEESTEKKRHFKQNEKPLKQILKVLR